MMFQITAAGDAEDFKEPFSLFFGIIDIEHRHSKFSWSIPRGKGTMRLTRCETPTRETRPDYNTGDGF